MYVVYCITKCIVWIIQVSQKSLSILKSNENLKKKGLRHEKYIYFKVNLHICVIYRVSKKSLSILKINENLKKRG